MASGTSQCAGVSPYIVVLMYCRKYNAFNLVRPLGPDDLLMMERVAGFHESGHEAGVVSELTPHQWAFFGVWYLR